MEVKVNFLVDIVASESNNQINSILIEQLDI